MTPAIEARMRAAVAGVVARVAAGLVEVPGVRVAPGDGEIVVEARGLRRRAVEEPALRWPGAAP